MGKLIPVALQLAGSFRTGFRVEVTQMIPPTGNPGPPAVGVLGSGLTNEAALADAARHMVSNRLADENDVFVVDDCEDKRLREYLRPVEPPPGTTTNSIHGPTIG
jgi:hypothetical protein